MPAAAFSQTDEVVSWLATPAGAAYRSVRTALVDVAHEVGEIGPPAVLLMPLLREGAAKGVSAAALLDAAQARLRHVTDSAAALAALRLPSSAAVLQRLVLLRLGGLGATVIERLLAAAEGRIERALLAGEALLQMSGVVALTEAQFASLGAALVAGTLQAEAFPSLLSVLIRARSSGLSDARAIELMTGALERGGGLVAIRTALERARRRR